MRHVLIDDAHAVRQRLFFVHDVLSPRGKRGGVSAHPALTVVLRLHQALFTHRILAGQIDAAAIVDIHDLDPGHVADLEHILDLFGALELEVLDLDEAILARSQLDPGAEVAADVGDLAVMTREARFQILDEIMLKAIAEPRKELADSAPKMIQMKINPDKIREVIGSGGKTIQKICAECDVKIDVEEDGHVFVSGMDIENVRRAIQVIQTITMDPEVGAIYKGKVTRLMQFGAFVEIAPGKEGLCHISKLDNKRVEKVEDVVKPGDEIVVKVVEIDQQGRINLSRKDALADIEARKNRK